MKLFVKCQGKVVRLDKVMGFREIFDLRRFEKFNELDSTIGK